MTASTENTQASLKFDVNVCSKQLNYTGKLESVFLTHEDKPMELNLIKMFDEQDPRCVVQFSVKKVVENNQTADLDNLSILFDQNLNRLTIDNKIFFRETIRLEVSSFLGIKTYKDIEVEVSCGNMT